MSHKYRIVKNEVTGRHMPQMKFLWFWVNIEDYPTTKEQAEDCVERNLRNDAERNKKNWMVVCDDKYHSDETGYSSGGIVPSDSGNYVLLHDAQPPKSE